MPEDRDIVQLFKEIKEQAGCDDLSAAILVAADRLSWLNVTIQVSEDGYPERLGNNIADAIEAVSKDGAIQLAIDGDILNVRGKVDVATDGPPQPPKPKAKSRK